VVEVTAEPEAQAPVHVRVRGWCDRCQGGGKLSARHLDLPSVDVDGVLEVAQRIVADATTRLAELAAGSHGCESAAEQARCEGRRDAAGEVLAALGVTGAQ
jgi:hypothetical protein